MTVLNIPDVMPIRVNGVHEVVELQLGAFPEITLLRFIQEGAGLMLGNASLGCPRLVSNKGSWNNLTTDQSERARQHWHDVILPGMIVKMEAGTLGAKGNTNTAARKAMKVMLNGTEPTEAQLEVYITSPEYLAQKKRERDVKEQAELESTRIGIRFLVSQRMTTKGDKWQEAIAWVAGNAHGYTPANRTLAIQELQDEFVKNASKGNKK